MPLLLTCDCGARFEVDGHLGGLQVSCPECLEALTAPAKKPIPSLDWVALFSVALALFGALTVVGTLAASIVGALSLYRIRRRPDTLGGRRFAFAGIGLGLGLTLITLVLYQINDHFPVGAWLRERRLTGQLDTTGNAPLGSHDGVCLLSKPPAGWGVMRKGTSGDPAIDDLQGRSDVFLINPRTRAFADLRREVDSDQQHLPLYFDQLRAEYATSRKPLLGDDAQASPLKGQEISPVDVKTIKLPPIDGYNGYEWTFDLPRGGETWRFLVRLYQKPANRMSKPSSIYVFRVYAPRERFQADEAELRAIADNLRFSQ